MTVAFELNGQPFTALTTSVPVQPAISQVICQTQEEVDDYWEKLYGGDETAQQCSWLRMTAFPGKLSPTFC